jgi:hypothetical protein
MSTAAIFHIYKASYTPKKKKKKKAERMVWKRSVVDVVKGTQRELFGSL